MPKAAKTRRAPVTGGNGSFECDERSGKWPKSWDSFALFESWLEAEQRKEGIEFIKGDVEKSTSQPPRFLKRQEYVCSRGLSGGEWQKREKKTARTIKKGTKKLPEGCPASIVIKTYPDTSTVLGQYHPNHSHETGNANIVHSRLSQVVKDQILDYLHLQIEPRRILEMIHGGSVEVLLSGQHLERQQLVTMEEIAHLRRKVKSEKRELHTNDDISTRAWIANLEDEGMILGYKLRSDPLPPFGPELETDGFYIVIQTEFQRQVFSKLDGGFLGIDGTHNVTQYQNTTLFSLIARDQWGHGVCVAWMVASSATQQSIEYFLTLFSRKNPTSRPSVFMTDFNWPQIHAIRRLYPSSLLLLCWWHVLHAWQKHFVVTGNPQLWAALKDWLRINNEPEFEAKWLEIQSMAPQSVTNYLQGTWIPVKQLWSAVYRQGRSILAQGDTNMLVEAWHHVLKGKFLNGSRNRRLDHLLHILTREVIPYYSVRWKRRALGFEGGNLVAQQRIQCNKKAAEIPFEHIKKINEHEFIVQSQTRQSSYLVQLLPDSCNCEYFAAAKFCKHLFAVFRFNEPETQETAFEGFSYDPGLLWAPNTVETRVENPHIQPPSIPSSIARISSKFQLLQPSTTAEKALVDIETTVDKALQEQKTTLPDPIRGIPPNIKTSTENALSLPNIKNKNRKRRDPYSGGVASGTLAKADAKGPPRQPKGPSQTSALPPTSQTKDHPPSSRNALVPIQLPQMPHPLLNPQYSQFYSGPGVPPPLRSGYQWNVFPGPHPSSWNF